MSEFRVLISDPLPAMVREILEASGRIEVLEGQGPIETDLPSVHGWIVRSGTTVDAASIERASSLRVVCRAGAGVDNVDIPAATARDIVVMNTADANANAAAEQSIALMFALARHLPYAHRSMVEGRWDRKAYVGVELQGKTLGVVGLGKIGRSVATKAAGLGMNVIGFDPITPEDVTAPLGITRVDLDGIWSAADWISLHVPMNDATRHLIGADNLARCRDGVRIVNCARGGVVDPEALIAAVDSGKVAGAALDVFDPEPLAEDSPLRSHDRIICVPHLGASTEEAQRNVGVMSAEQVRDYLLDGEIRNRVGG
ncbi:MAG: hydroxyacid dehydrogenase [Planctomycetota bacterium]|jgi:D-3-phosphoglycerate dehydrogenase